MAAINDCVTSLNSFQNARYVQDVERSTRLTLTLEALSLACSLSCVSAAFLELITVLLGGRLGFI